MKTEGAATKNTEATEKLVAGDDKPQALNLLPSAFCLLPSAFCLLPSKSFPPRSPTPQACNIIAQGNALGLERRTDPATV
jgi:hypothetical protein